MERFDGLVAIEHAHEWRFSHSFEDWWDGDEQEVYVCDCGERDYRYIPR